VIDFSPFISTLRAWVAAASGLPLAAVLLENEPRPRVPPAWFEIRIERSNMEGTDRLRFVEVEGEQVEAVNGIRLLEVVIACDSFSQESARIALGFVEAVRARGMFTNKRAILNAGCIAVVDLGEITNADYTVDERWISRFELRTRFRYTFESIGTLPDDLAYWIAETEITGTFPPAAEGLTP